MKKLAITFILAIMPYFVFSQLKVSSTGNASVGPATPYDDTKLYVYSNWTDSINYGTNIYGICQDIYVPNTGYAYGVAGRAIGRLNQNTSCHATGVRGVAGNAANGLNFGLLGTISNKNGSGLFASGNGYLGVPVDRKYAGYFLGKVCITDSTFLNGPIITNGTLTAYDIMIPSDSEQRENVRPITNEKTEKTVLESLMNMNVITYNYKDKLFKKGGSRIRKIDEEGNESIVIEEDIESAIDTKQRHFGVSEQDIQNEYPDLMRKSHDGTLGVNYIEMVPLLLRSIQELKQELDAVKGGSEYKTRFIEGIGKSTR